MGEGLGISSAKDERTVEKKIKNGSTRKNRKGGPRDKNTDTVKSRETD